MTTCYLFAEQNNDVAPPERTLPHLPYALKHHHHENGIFINNYVPHHDKSFWEIMKWRMSRNSPKPVEFPVHLPDTALLNSKPLSQTMTWLGHSTFLLQVEGLTVLTDPHLSERPSPVSWAGPKRYTPAPIAIDDLPLIDVVLISHDHYDHLDTKTLKHIEKKQNDDPPLYLAPLGIGKWLKKKGMRRVVELDWWQNHAAKGFRFYSTPVQHWCRRSLRDRNKRLWTGWAIESHTRIIYFGGDSGYTKDFKDTGKFLGKVDLALLPIGAYDPRFFMRVYHMNPEEAVQAAIDVNAQLAVGMHFGTFELTDEPYDEPLKRLKTAVKNAGKDKTWFRTLEHGQTHIWKGSDLQPSQPGSRATPLKKQF